MKTRQRARPDSDEGDDWQESLTCPRREGAHQAGCVIIDCERLKQGRPVDAEPLLQPARRLRLSLEARLAGWRRAVNPLVFDRTCSLGGLEVRELKLLGDDGPITLPLCPLD